MNFRRYALFIAIIMIFALMCSSIVVVASENISMQVSQSTLATEPTQSAQPIQLQQSVKSQQPVQSQQSVQSQQPVQSMKSAESAGTQPSVRSVSAQPQMIVDSGSEDQIPAAPVATGIEMVTADTAAVGTSDDASGTAVVVSQEGLTVGIDISNASIGFMKASYVSASGKRVKVIINKGIVSYIYNLANNGTFESYPLQSGDGEYAISIMENTKENYYKQIGKMIVSVDIEDEEDVFLNSIQNIDWNDSPKVIEKAAELIKGASSDEERISRIYNFIIDNFSYDFSKLSRLTAGYLPDIESMMDARKGICYDFSSLFASMLRSVGIPSKLVMGKSNNAVGYHAWNEVYLESSGKWAIVDTTCDAQLRASGKAVGSMYKAAGSYILDKCY